MTATPSDDQAQRNERDKTFAAIALPHLSTIARVANALTGDAADTEDLVQETFLRAYRHWHTFQPGSDCKSWLATICRHTFAELRRRQNRAVVVDDQELESLAAARVHKAARDKGVDDMFARLDLGPAIAKAIRALEPHYRDVVLLVDVDGFSYDEVATSLDIPVGTVRSRLYRARRHLQESLLTYAIDAGYASASYTLPPTSTERRNA